MDNRIQHINPDGLMKSPAFSQVIVTQGPGKTIYVGGQNSVTADNEVVGKDDLAAQTAQVMRNFETALAAAGADWNHVIKLTILLVQGQDAVKAYGAAQGFLQSASKPPAVTAVFIAGLGNPEYLVEIEGVAFLPED